MECVERRSGWRRQAVAAVAALVFSCASGLVGLGRLVSNCVRAAEPAAVRLPDKPIADFTLSDFHGQKHRLSAVRAPVVVLVFLGAECPLAQLYGPRLQQIADAQGKRVAVWGINSNAQDSLRDLAGYSQRNSTRFPLLKDVGNRVADQLDARRTPEAFVLDAERRVRYRGKIDDQYGVGVARDKPQQRYLEEAIEAVLAGKAVKTPRTEAVGCHIGRKPKPRKTSKVTYSRHIAPLLRKHCVECHQKGEIAPFALTDYDEVAGWAETLLEAVNDQRMPPWHANPKYGKFVNERRLLPEEKRLLASWVEAGAPQGAPLGDPLPKAPEAEAASQVTARPSVAPTSAAPLRKPDRVVAMRKRPFRVPAEGIVEYQYYVVDPEFKTDKWIVKARVIPGNRAVVHHAIVFVRPPRQERVRGIGWLTAYVPGQNAIRLSEGLARRVPAGSKLVFQMHYTPNGSPQEDLTKVELTFGDPKRVREELVTLLAMDRQFEIPPRDPSCRVEMVFDGLPRAGRLLSMAPHMHVRGKSFRFIWEHKGAAEILLDVPRYDFNWQHVYVLQEPKPLAPGAKIRCIAHYDNSAANLANPNPDAEVRWGDQTWEEMFIGYLEVAIPVGADLRDQANEEVRRQDAQKVAAAFIARFDQNRDRVVDRNEAPSALSTFAFGKYDRNGDKQLSSKEVLQMALDSVRRKKRR